MDRILRKLKRGYKNNREIVSFDAETYHTFHPGYTKNNFLLCGIKTKDADYIFNTREETIRFLLGKKCEDKMIFASNLDFDFNIVFGGHPILKKFFVIEKMGKIIYARVKKGRHKWEFFDTYNFQRLSVEAMGKLLKLPKLGKPECMGKKDLTQEERKILEDYCIRDCEVTYLFAQYIQDFCNMLGCKMKITIASTGQDYWRRHHQPFNLIQEPRHIIEKHFLGSFHGGRVEVIKRGKFKNVYYYDFNSHYPAMCMKGLDGEGAYPNPNTYVYEKNITKHLVNKYHGITEVDIEAPDMYIPYLGITIDDKYIFPTGRFKAWFHNFEIRKAIKLGYKVHQYHEGIYYTETFVPFKDMALKLWGLRKKFEEQDNQPMRSMVKLMMNSGMFGKFGQKIDTKTEMIHESNVYSDGADFYTITRKGKRRYLIDARNRGDFFFNRVKNPKRIPMCVHPILASTTTALARSKLWDYLNQYPEDVIYCDTDSITLKQPRFESGSDLGELKLELVGKTAVFIRPKWYSINEIVKAKGVGRAISDVKDFNKCLELGEVTTTRFTHIKESHIRGMPYGSVIDVVKRIGFEDNKREWKKKFDANSNEDSKPLKM